MNHNECPPDCVRSPKNATIPTRPVIPAEAVEAVCTAGCLECDWRYYALTEARARNWAEAHAADEGHLVAVEVPKTTI
jgi:hypothetical protein